MIKVVSDTMVAKFEESKRVDYVVVKIGDRVYSTKYDDIMSGSVNAKIQLVNTKGIGEQFQLWVKGEFDEINKHQKLPKPLPFEINIYFHEDESS